MKSIEDLKSALALAHQKKLIHNFEFHSLFIDIDFCVRDEETRQKMLQLRDYILASYEAAREVEYMPVMNRLRVYICN